MENNLNREIFNDELLKAESICILGHISPDGDCIGSVLASLNYIQNLRGTDFPVQAYLEEVGDKFLYLNGSESVCCDPRDARCYSLALVCDCADPDRMGRFRHYMDHAGICLMIDHHITNPGFGDYRLVLPHASSSCEVLFGLFEDGFINRFVAECIYTGVIHDTGVFRHSSTSPRTMCTAARCMEYGIDFNRIIEESFFSMTFAQKHVLGWLLSNMESRLDGRLMTVSLDMPTRKVLGAEQMDMDGMIDHMRTTTGALLAAYMYETKDGRCKLSLRSNTDSVDVSRIAAAYGGGGHKRAAGCFMGLDFDKNKAEIEAAVLAQISGDE